MSGAGDVPKFEADDDGEDSPHEPMFSPDDDGGAEGFAVINHFSMEELRDRALRVFGEAMRRRAGKDIPLPTPEEAHQYLSLDELEAILREHGRQPHGGTAIGGATREEAEQKLREMMSAVQSRILSNVLREAVQRGMLNCEFDPETNDFSFSVTDEARERYNTDDDEHVDP